MWYSQFPSKWQDVLLREVPDLEKRELFVFDMDGTLTGTISGSLCANASSDVFLLPGTLKYISKLREAGRKLAIWSNQGGVSHGFMNKKTSWDILLRVDQYFGGFDTINVAFFHPSGRRKKWFPDISKPKPDMLFEIMDELQVGPSETVAVGNAFTDQVSAEAAGVPFLWAHVFFGWSPETVVQDNHGWKILDDYLDGMRAQILRSRA